MSIKNSRLLSDLASHISSLWFVRLPLLLVGVLVPIWAVSNPVFRNPEQILTGLIGLPVAVSVTLIIIGLTLRTAWQRSAAWFALALVAQAVSFQLINAGWQLRYQHLKPIGEMFSFPSSVFFAFLICQLLLVAIGMYNRRHQIWLWLRTSFRRWQLVIILATVLISTTTVSENVYFYAGELVFASVLLLVQLGNVVLVGMAIPERPGGGLRSFYRGLFGDLAADDSIKPGPPDLFAVGLAVFVVLLAALLSIYSYERHPHVPDEVAYLTQARFFASGALTMPAPPVPEAFEVYLMEVKGDQWYPVTPPGWAMLLAIGVSLGTPWLVNPVLAGINLLLAFALLRELFPRPIVRISLFLLAISPWYLFLGMSFMTHMFALTCALLAALGVAWSRRKGSVIWAWAGGFALGFLALIRPLEAVAMAGLLGLWSVGLGGKRLKSSAIAGLVLGSMIIGGVGLLFNARLTGDPARFPIMEYTDEHFGRNSNAYGFGPDRGMGWALDPNPGHGPVDALINSNLNVSALSTELFGWSIGSFLLIALFLFAGKSRKNDYLMLAVIAAIYGLHFFHYFSGGPDFGARYWFLMIIPLVVLTAKGMGLLSLKLRAQTADADIRVFTVILALSFMTLVNFIPWRAIDKYHDFRGMRPDIRVLAQEYKFGKSLVLVQGNRHPDFDSAVIYNRLDFDADAPVFAWDRNPETRRKLLAEYSDRPIWIVKSPSLTGRGFEVTAGPINAESLLRQRER